MLRFLMLFIELSARGYLAKLKWACCQSCGWAEMEALAEKEGMDMDSKNIVFATMQDWEGSFGRRGSKMKNPLYLAWRGDGNAIVAQIKSTGLRVVWDIWLVPAAT